MTCGPPPPLSRARGRYGFATFDLTSTWTTNTHGSGDYNRAYGHLGATYGYQSVVAYFPEMDLSLAVASNIETDKQVQPSDVSCHAYNAVLAALRNEPELACTYVPTGYFGGKCNCRPAPPSPPPPPPIPGGGLFPGIHTIFRRNPFTFAAILLSFGLGIRVLVSGFG